jgi:radical SAM protein with 4Fe4S-binding SPASM domain
MPALVPELPTELQVEVTGSCNLACPMCLVRYRPALSRRQGSMPFELFRRAADALPGLRRITLQGLGEPLLAPELFRMVDYAAGRGVAMGFNTNGTLLTGEVAERLVAGGLAWLHVSLDGATPTTYEAIRDGSSFERVRRNVAGLVAAKRALGSETPRLSVVFVAMRRNIAELPAMVQLAADWNLERLWVQNLSHSFSDTSPEGTYRQIRDFAAAEALWSGEDRQQAEALFAQARRLADRLGVPLRLPRLSADHPGAPRREPGSPGCDWPWRSAYVTHEGRVQPCCMVMGSERAVLGDLRESGFPEVWSSPGYQSFRAGLLTDDAPPEVCRGCSAFRGVF